MLSDKRKRRNTSAKDIMPSFDRTHEDGKNPCESRDAGAGAGRRGLMSLLKGKRRAGAVCGKTAEQRPAAEALTKKAIRRILAVILAGLLLMAVDLVKSADPGIKIVREGSSIYLVRPDEEDGIGHMQMNVSVKGSDETVEKDIDIALDPYSSEEAGEDEESSADETEMTENERIEYELRKITGNFNEDCTARKVLLPDRLDTGESIIWKVNRESNSIVILFIIIIVSFAIFKTHLSPLEKLRKQEQESVIRNLPEFVNKLVLLLNAGLVLNSAFEQTLRESLRFRGDSDDYFMRRIKEIYVSVKTTNSSVNDEFRRFAKENGTMELMRISNIVNDNINKGVELTEKLQRESEVLWINRKKNCEERGRLAETKLTLPLMIFLVVLIVITVAPALMGL